MIHFARQTKHGGVAAKHWFHTWGGKSGRLFHPQLLGRVVGTLPRLRGLANGRANSDPFKKRLA